MKAFMKTKESKPQRKTRPVMRTVNPLAHVRDDKTDGKQLLFPFMKDL